MNQIIPIIGIAICIIAGVIAFFFIKRSKQQNQTELSDAQITANEFINVKDIKDRFLYTRDGQIIMYIKINSISIDLFSDTEKEQICRALTAELSSIRKPFKFLAVSRPVDISPLINEYTQLLSETNNQKQKELLRNEMMVMSNYAISGDVVERQFYIMIWDKYHENVEKDILKECREFVNKFESGNIRCEILKEQEIVRLCNLVNNPAYVQVEDTETITSMTNIK
ncbi:hypothetical protein [Tepidibacter hydrothermalis]|uniref:Uncharacterized protein n=1 Tax=Tepidibacter hydrothermalis TaxID=3036126 RepID=A0ABY8ED57_9FIRM|nr:hypothetical protein [Tepidibacter hydrothermalis]WFD10869.1 hypothetical protein P4S50_01990 [Tepidibacter hydrothermalis]